jgi:DNA-binding XRE family transcriptional regulator
LARTTPGDDYSQLYGEARAVRLSAVPLSLTEAFGLAVREVRIARGLSQDDAADAAQVDRTTFGQVERAVKSPTLRTVEKMAAGLGIRPVDLMLRAQAILDESR